MIKALDLHQPYSKDFYTDGIDSVIVTLVTMATDKQVPLNSLEEEIMLLVDLKREIERNGIKHKHKAA